MLLLLLFGRLLQLDDFWLFDNCLTWAVRSAIIFVTSLVTGATEVVGNGKPKFCGVGTTVIPVLLTVFV